MLEADIADGALGIGLLVAYAPGASPEEYLRVAALAAASGTPTFTHSRDLFEFTPDGPIDGAEEIVRAAGETGPACTTATSTAPRSGTPTEYSG